MGETEPNIEHIPTEYFDIADSHPEFKGDFTGEILNNENGPTLHIQKGSSRKLSQQGSGDIVILGISEKGWERVGEVVNKLGSEAKMSDVKKALAEADFITWGKLSTGR